MRQYDTMEFDDLSRAEQQREIADAQRPKRREYAPSRTSDRTPDLVEELIHMR